MDETSSTIPEISFRKLRRSQFKDISGVVKLRLEAWFSTGPELCKLLKKEVEARGTNLVRGGHSVKQQKVNRVKHLAINVVSSNSTLLSNCEISMHSSANKLN